MFFSETHTSINVSITNTGQTWVMPNWTIPVNFPPNILHYEVTKILNFDGTGNIMPVGQTKSFNITNLEPGKAYDFTVVVATEGGGVIGRSVPSDPVKFGK